MRRNFVRVVSRDCVLHTGVRELSLMAVYVKIAGFTFERPLLDFRFLFLQSFIAA